MRFTILTLFPGIIQGVLDHSILKRALERGLITVDLVQIRDFAPPPHRQVDDAPYGGTPGMVLKPNILAAALAGVRPEASAEARPWVIHLTPHGAPFRQETAARLAKQGHLALVCGRYEGVDERFVQACVDEELSLGDFVLTGGEIAAMAVLDAVARLLPGVLGDDQSALAESFSDGLLEHPHYTRPPVWQGRTVPKVLLSGDHGRVAEWRRREALVRTLVRRPELLEHAGLNKVEKRMMELLRRDLDALETERANLPHDGSSGVNDQPDNSTEDDK